MDVCTRKTAIIRTTRQLIIRNGIRAVRIDDIAEVMGISKRTVYETFSAKAELVQTCLKEIERDIRQKVSATSVYSGQNPIARVLALTEECIDLLHNTERSFWYDIKYMPEYRHIFSGIKKYVLHETVAAMDVCRREGYIKTDTDTILFSEILLSSLYRARLDHHPYPHQITFGHIMIRGIAETPGIVWLDKIRKDNNPVINR